MRVIKASPSLENVGTLMVESIKAMLSKVMLLFTMENIMTKKYVLINRKSGKVFRQASTRDVARSIKRDYGFKHSIVDTSRMAVVR